MKTNSRNPFLFGLYHSVKWSKLTEDKQEKPEAWKKKNQFLGTNIHENSNKYMIWLQKQCIQNERSERKHMPLHCKDINILGYHSKNIVPRITHVNLLLKENIIYMGFFFALSEN